MRASGRTQPCPLVDFSPGDAFRASDLQNGKIVSWCRAERLRYMVTYGHYGSRGKPVQMLPGKSVHAGGLTALYEAGGCPYSESIQTKGFGACPQPWQSSSTREAGKAKVTSSPWNCLFGPFFFFSCLNFSIIQRFLKSQCRKVFTRFGDLGLGSEGAGDLQKRP